MINQSGSMSNSYAGSTKAKFAALEINRLITEIMIACTVGDEIRDRVYVAVIGYGNNHVNVMVLGKVSDLAKNSQITTIKKKVSDGVGGLVELDEIVQVFVNDTASGGTPINEAFQESYKGVEKFISNNPNSVPPLVINITDGKLPDNIHTPLTDQAKRITSLKTADGNVILMNVCLDTGLEDRRLFPGVNYSSNSRDINLLFNISTVLPDALTYNLKNQGVQLESNSKAFVLNDSPNQLMMLIRQFMWT